MYGANAVKRDAIAVEMQDREAAGRPVRTRVSVVKPPDMSRDTASGAGAFIGVALLMLGVLVVSVLDTQRNAVRGGRNRAQPAARCRARGLTVARLRERSPTPPTSPSSPQPRWLRP